jgi:hypothetical protein
MMGEKEGFGGDTGDFGENEHDLADGGWVAADAESAEAIDRAELVTFQEFGKMRCQARAKGKYRYYRCGDRDVVYPCGQKGLRTSVFNSQVVNVPENLQVREEWRQNALAVMGEILGEQDLEEKLAAFKEMIRRMASSDSNVAPQFVDVFAGGQRPLVLLLFQQPLFQQELPRNFVSGSAVGSHFPIQPLHGSLVEPR